MINRMLTILMLVSLNANAEPSDDSLVAISSRTLNYFLTAAECLSLNATESEKRGFLTARLMNLEWDINSGQIMSKEWFLKRISAEDEDRDEIYQAINKYCPQTAKSIVSSVSADGFSSSTAPALALANVAIKAISVDILSKDELRSVFEAENSALGVKDIY